MAFSKKVSEEISKVIIIATTHNVFKCTYERIFFGYNNLDAVVILFLLCYSGSNKGFK